MALAALPVSSMGLPLKDTRLTWVTCILLLISSYASLKQSEAISFYTSGRNYIANGQIAAGITQVRRAIDRAPEVIPLQDAYGRLCLQLMGTDERAQGDQAGASDSR